jgi:deoxyribodipyrimidine photo-lyase
MLHSERIKQLNNNGVNTKGNFILYWMQASQRVEYNHALEHAIELGTQHNQPVVVFFGLTDDFLGANERHYHFMLEGLQEVQNELQKRNILFILWRSLPHLAIPSIANEASMVVVDRAYLDIERHWRTDVAENIDCPLIQVESNVVVPIETASPKEEYGAYTIRPKIQKQLDTFLKPLKARKPKQSSLELDFASEQLSDIPALLKTLAIDSSVKPVTDFRGGTSHAKKHLEQFIAEKLDRYDDLRNDPTQDYLSNMSPYLHFGQISPLYIALQILATDSTGQASYLEELIVRRELSMNFVYYNEKYFTLTGALPDWAKTTLLEHQDDPREYSYSLEEFEQGKTHDHYWNAAQQQMVLTGKMHGYMRMYWGKKILEWSKTPQEAFAIALQLNNKYELDGRDANGYTGVAWCFGKHDRAWKERPVFGKVRYMNANGLRRKFDIELYVKQIQSLQEEKS